MYKITLILRLPCVSGMFCPKLQFARRAFLSEKLVMLRLQEVERHVAVRTEKTAPGGIRTTLSGSGVVRVLYRFAATEQNTFQIDFFAENSLYQIYFSVKNSKKVSKE